MGALPLPCGEDGSARWYLVKGLSKGRDRDDKFPQPVADSKGPLEYFLPRPLRKVLWGTAAASAALSAAVGAAKLSSSPALEAATGGPQNLVINVAVFAATAAAFLWEGCAAPLLC